MPLGAMNKGLAGLKRPVANDRVNMNVSCGQYSIQQLVRFANFNVELHMVSCLQARMLAIQLTNFQG